MQAIVGFGRDWLRHFVQVQGIDRAMAIGAQAYTALFPLLIVYASLLPRKDNESFSEVLVRRFDLGGSSADSLRQAFAPAGAVQSSVTVLGMLILLVSSLSFTRGLQRLYEGSYELEKLGMKNTPRGLLWLAFLALFVTLRPIVTDPFGGALSMVVNIAVAVTLWTITPYLLLGRRVPWHRLVPAGLLTAIGMTGVSVYSVIWMPRTIASSAAQFGVIGIGFALLTWLVVAASVIVVATTGGATIAEYLERHRNRRAPA